MIENILIPGCILALCLVALGFRTYLRLRRPVTGHQSLQGVKKSWLRWPKFTWKWSTIVWSVIWIWLLVVIGPWVLPLLWEIPRASLQAKLSPAQVRLPSLDEVRMPPKDENDLRETHFLEGAKKFGWETLPTRCDVVVPLNDTAISTGLNLTFLEGSGRLHIGCYGYTKGLPIKVYVHDNEPGEVQVFDRDKDLNIPPAAGVLHARGVNTDRRRALAPVTLHLEAKPNPGHVRIATWKVCDGGMKNRWGLLQTGSSKKAWKFYVRFADPNTGFTISSQVMQQNPGAMLVSTEASDDEESLRPIFSRSLSLGENTYDQYVAGDEENPLLLIETPRIVFQGNVLPVLVEVILDINNTRW